jgi:putative DNA primase/helicase
VRSIFAALRKRSQRYGTPEHQNIGTNQIYEKEIIMANTFCYASFLDEMDLLDCFVCINEVNYKWNGNHWEALTDKSGEAWVLDWIRTNDPASLSKSVSKQAWEALKLALLESTPKIELNNVVIPCQGAYVCMDDDGQITTTTPQKNLYRNYVLGCPYDPAAKTPLFDAFLDQILPDMGVRQRVQEYIGYSLLPDNRFQRAALWLGSGANGKGVLSNIVQKLHAKTQAIQLDNNSRFALSGLYDASLIVADELPARKLDEAKLKSVIAGEKVFIDIKGQMPITTRVRGKLLVLGNNYPVVDDSSEGFWRRWDVVPFKATIAEADRDPRLAERIIGTELAGVLNWALEGLARLLKRDGFDPVQPEAMKYSMQMAKKVANDVTGWLSERVVSVGGVPSLHKRVVYNDYTLWCIQNDFVPQSPQAFWLKIKRCRTDLVDKKIRLGKGFQYVCSITLKDKDELDAANAGEFLEAA